MTVVAIACARDEVDVIEPFVRHTLGIAWRLVVLDNGSTDGTRDVLASLQQEGLPLDVIDDPSPGKYLSQRLTRLMRDHAVARYDASWIVPLDVDEFLDADDPSSLFATSPATGDTPLLVQWRSYVPHESDDGSELNAVRRIRHRLADEPDALWKVIVPGALARRADAVIVQGSHAVEANGRHVPAVHRYDASLAHFPVRSAEQFVAKTVIGHLQNEVMPFRDSSWGWHHRDHYERLKIDPGGFAADLPRLAERYSRLGPDPGPASLVNSPLRYRGGALRYTASAAALSAWPPVLRYVQDLARQHALATGALEGSERMAFDEEHRVRRALIDQLADRDRTMLELRSQTERLNRDIDLLRRSWTWRAGRAVLGPGRVLARGWRLLRGATPFSRVAPRGR